MAQFTSEIIERDGIKFLNLQEDYSEYHRGNNSRASNAVKDFIASHDDTNSYIFFDSDIRDLYGMALERNDGNINFAELIELAIYAGMCADKWATEPEKF